ncbi:MAG: hypothetical protein Q8P88_01360 [Candidatus Jorgensenbacteria bacterium]|nr:hypothetical protein [Candidatus Jorgensenbacteria bacterium]
MIAALVYVIRRAGYRIAEFLRHWYVKSAKIYFNFVLDRLSRLDYFFAWKITARHLFQPLYHDYSIVGYVLGFLFRSARLVLASGVYGALFALALGCYVVWLIIPPLLLILAFAPSLI